MPDSACKLPAASQAATGYIDAHVHVWTTDFNQYPLAAGYSPEAMRPASFTADELLSICRPLNVNRVVLIQMVFYGFDNTYMLDCIQQYPGVFSGVALIDEHSADPAGEMCRLHSLGVRGVRIVPPSPGAKGWLDAPGMQAMWRAAAEKRMAMCALVDVADLPAIDRMCRAYRDTIVVIDHCARIGGDGVIQEPDVAELCRLAEYPHVYVKLSAFYFLGAKRPPYVDLLPMLRQLVAAFGPKRLMWATDCPFQVLPPHSYRASLELVNGQFDSISESDRQWILSRTAEAVFFK
jgi:predicted TIM-barrel fold metal-dependent hydrolase